MVKRRWSRGESQCDPHTLPIMMFLPPLLSDYPPVIYPHPRANDFHRTWKRNLRRRYVLGVCKHTSSSGRCRSKIATASRSLMAERRLSKVFFFYLPWLNRFFKDIEYSYQVDGFPYGRILIYTNCFSASCFIHAKLFYKKNLLSVKFIREIPMNISFFF